MNISLYRTGAPARNPSGPSGGIRGGPKQKQLTQHHNQFDHFMHLYVKIANLDLQVSKASLRAALLACTSAIFIFIFFIFYSNLVFLGPWHPRVCTQIYCSKKLRVHFDPFISLSCVHINLVL